MRRTLYQLFWKRKQSQSSSARPTSPPQRIFQMTLPLIAHGSDAEEKTICDNSGSFLRSLPLEIRLRVYEQVFGNVTLHIEYEYEIATQQWIGWHCICTIPPIFEFWHDQCRNLELPPLSQRNKISINILLACRQIYAEAIGILYKSNTFKFCDISMALWLGRLIPPQSLQLIRSLEIQWNYMNHDDQPTASEHAKASYDEKWAVLAAMGGLRRLRIYMSTLGRLQTPDEEIDNVWLGPLDTMSQVDQLTLFMPDDIVRLLRQPKRRTADSSLPPLSLLPYLDAREYAAVLRPEAQGRFRRVVGVPLMEPRCHLP